MTAPTLPGYVLDSVLGRGSMGTVHLARRADWAGRLVAVKRVPSAGSGLARTLRYEAEVLAGLDHPHIVRILDLVPDGEGVAIAMQYAAGGSLPDLLAHRGRLSPGQVVAVAAPLADALASAHRRGLLHCDVKPANVLFTSDGEPLLSDFGLARRIASPGGGAGHEPVTGTAEYLDPVVAAGGPADQCSDVYGLGAVCYELLSGQPPYSGATPEAVLAAAVARPPAALGTLTAGAPLALVQAVERAMARNPADRFPDAAAFAAALRAAAPAVGVSPVAPGGTTLCTGPTGPAASLVDAPATDDAGAAVAGPGSPFPSGPPAPRRPTLVFGPRPPLPPRPPSGRRPPIGRRRASAAALALLLGVSVTAFAFLLQPTAPAADRAAVSSRATCPPVDGPLRADDDGDGCWSAVSWQGNVASIAARRYELGRPGDTLLLGDWDCDGSVTPALHRPSTGEVFLFDGWPAASGPVEAARDGGRLAPGAIASVERRGGCDTVAPRPPPSLAPRAR